MVFEPFQLAQAIGSLATAGALAAAVVQLYQYRQALERTRIATQTSQYEAALRLIFDWRSEIIHNPSLAEGFKNTAYYQNIFKNLNVPAERYFHTLELVNIFEYYWLLRNRNVIEENMWEGWRQNLFHFAEGSPEFRAVWRSMNRNMFHQEFVALVNKAVDVGEQAQGVAPALELLKAV